MAENLSGIIRDFSFHVSLIRLIQKKETTTMRRLLILVFSAMLALSSAPAFAKGSSHGSKPRASKSSGGPVHVKGYTKKNGTVVAPYNRKAPKQK